MIIDVECPRCNGMGECHTATPNQRARYVRHDDMSPDDYTESCPKCGGSGTVDYDPAVDDRYEPDEFDDCGLMPDGQCTRAGSEECDWECGRLN